MTLLSATENSSRYPYQHFVIRDILSLGCQDDPSGCIYIVNSNDDIESLYIGAIDKSGLKNFSVLDSFCDFGAPSVVTIYYGKSHISYLSHISISERCESHKADSLEYKIEIRHVINRSIPDSFVSFSQYVSSNRNGDTVYVSFSHISSINLGRSSFKMDSPQVVDNKRKYIISYSSDGFSYGGRKNDSINLNVKTGESIRVMNLSSGTLPISQKRMDSLSVDSVDRGDLNRTGPKPTTGVDEGRKYRVNELLQLINHWGEIESQYDVDGDGVIGIGDVKMLVDGMGVPTFPTEEQVGLRGCYPDLLDYTLRIEPTYPGNTDRFGASVSSSGDYILVGAPWRVINGVERSGAVYLFRISPEGGYSQLFEIHSPSNPDQLGGCFGESTSMSGNRFVIGEPYAESGLVHIYEIIDGGDRLELQSTFGRGSSYDGWFGFSVSMSSCDSECRVAVGCPYCSPSTRGSGEVWVST